MIIIHSNYYSQCCKTTKIIKKQTMKTINPKCTNEDSFMYSIFFSLHYFDLKIHRERTNKLYKYINNYNFKSNNYQTFENNNLNISLIVYD